MATNSLRRLREVEADTAAAGRPSILFVDPDCAETYMRSMRVRFEISVAASQDAAIRALRVLEPTFVITELALPGGDGVLVCREAKALADPPCVVATTAHPERVPEALMAGSDSVLLKPFTPSLLSTRIGRLLQQRAQALQAATLERAAHDPRIEALHRSGLGTNTVWPDEHCPACRQPGAVSFDAASYRRMWYACLACRQVWMGPARAAQPGRVRRGANRFLHRL